MEDLKIYQDDHRAGASAGTDRARRLWRQNRSGPWGTELNENSRVAQGRKVAREILGWLGWV